MKLQGTKLFRGKRICCCSYTQHNKIGFSASLKRQILHKEQYLNKKAHKFFYLKNPDGDEYIMGFFGLNNLVVTLSYYDKDLRLWLTNT